MTDAKRPLFLTGMVLLFTLLAISNATKWLQAGLSPVSGFVFFGVRFDTLSMNLALGLPFAALLAAYARGLWTMRRWVTYIAVPYAFYVPVNLVLFWFFAPADQLPAIGGILGYLFFALGGSVGTALYLMRHYDDLE
jgi:hypothetical protein